MPDQNNPTDVSSTPAQVNPPSEPNQIPTPPAPMDIPVGDASMPPPFPPEVAPPEDATPPPDSGSAAPSFDIPPVISPAPKSKGGGKRVIATILGLLVLVGGLGAGIILVQQQQDIRERAVTPCRVCSGSTCVRNKPPCSDDLNRCSLSTDCAPAPQPPPPAPTTAPAPPAPPGPPSTPCTMNSQCTSPLVCRNGRCAYECTTDSECGGNYVCMDNRCGPECTNDSQCGGGKVCQNNKCVSGTSPSPGGTCTLTGSEICVGNNQTGDCYQGGQGNQYACYKLKGNPGKKISGSTSCTCPAPYTWGPRQEYGSWWCFNTAITDCTPSSDTSEQCSLQPQQCASPTPPPGGGPTAQCLNVKAYDTSWNLLTTDQLKALKVGDKVRFTVGGTTTGGSFDKAKFKINGVQRPEVTQKKPSSEEYYDEYTIPEAITTFTINAQIHHTTLGWSE